LVQTEKATIERDIEKKDEEVNEMNEQIKNDLENYEKVQLKLLTYRKEDILDLLSSLKNMGKMQGTVVKLGDLKKKQESLQGELLNIDDELFELEKKYGEFKVK
jgi:hypothetical protein